MPLTPSEEEQRRRCIIDPSTCLVNQTPASAAIDLLNSAGSVQAQAEMVCSLVGSKPYASSKTP